MKSYVLSKGYGCWRKLWHKGRKRGAKTEQIPPDLDKFLEYYNFFTN